MDRHKERQGPPQAAPSTRGFTLVELMVVVVLLAVLAAYAVPSFADMSRRQRVEALKDTFIASLQLARTEAVRLGQPVVLRRIEPCPEASGAGDWRCGWRVFADFDGNNILSEGDFLLQESQATPTAVLRKAGAVNPNAIYLNRHGHVTQGGTRIEIYPAGNGFSAIDGLLVCFPTGSRIRTVRAAVRC